MLQTLIAAVMAGTGVYLLTGDSIFFGIILLILGAAMLNGANQGVWLCFHFGDSDSGGDVMAIKR